MSNARSSIIAFLSGLGSEFTHTNPPGSGRGAGHTHTNPPGSGRGAGHTHTDPVGKDAATTHTNPPGGPGKSKPDFPFDPRALQSWEGLDAPWTYSSEETLMMQALRKSRAKITRLGDSRALSPVNPQAQPLWKWAPEFRAEAVSGELHSRLQVHGRSVWLVEPPAAASGSANATLRAQRLIDVPDLADLEAAEPAPGQRRDQGYTADEQIDRVMRAAVEREDRLPEILIQARGLWPFFQSITGVQLERVPAFFDLLIALESWTLRALMQIKHHIAAPRPVERSSLVMPLIDTPGHGSLPSGHATQAAFNAELLSLLMYHDAEGRPLAAPQNRTDLLDRFARRAAFNREVAGVHFPVDSLAGYWLGRQLALAVAALAEPTNPAHALRRLTVGRILQGNCRLEEVTAGTRPPMPAGTKIRLPEQARALAALWARARLELNQA
jgi:membrane-associated phospholipid phosphatase